MFWLSNSRWQCCFRSYSSTGFVNKSNPSCRSTWQQRLPTNIIKSFKDLIPAWNDYPLSSSSQWSALLHCTAQEELSIQWSRNAISWTSEKLPSSNLLFSLFSELFRIMWILFFRIMWKFHFCFQLMTSGRCGSWMKLVAFQRWNLECVSDASPHLAPVSLSGDPGFPP